MNVLPPRGKEWRLEDSIFAKKVKENDSKSFLNLKGISGDAFDFDWAMCCRKSRFIRLVEKNATQVSNPLSS
jgi:hypothetical protein